MESLSEEEKSRSAEEDAEKAKPDSETIAAAEKMAVNFGVIVEVQTKMGDEDAPRNDTVEIERKRQEKSDLEKKLSQRKEEITCKQTEIADLNKFVEEERLAAHEAGRHAAEAERHAALSRIRTNFEAAILGAAIEAAQALQAGDSEALQQAEGAAHEAKEKRRSTEEELESRLIDSNMPEELGDAASSGVKEEECEEVDNLNDARCKENRESDKKHHKGFIPVWKALNFRKLDSDEARAEISKEHCITQEFELFLNSEQAMEWLETVSNAVVQIKVVKGGKIASNGTGTYIRYEDESFVVTGSHVIQSGLAEKKDSKFGRFNPENIEIYFRDVQKHNESKKETPIKVSRIGNLSAPKKNKMQNFFEEIKHNLNDGKEETNEDVKILNEVFKFLPEVFHAFDANMDYVILWLDSTPKVEPITMERFEILDHFRNVKDFPENNSDKSDVSKYPRSLYLYAVSHPHGVPEKQLSFGEMESDLAHAYLLNVSRGQNESAMLEGKEPFIEHSVTTCTGSSGCPLFYFIISRETNEHGANTNQVIIHRAMHFLHQGSFAKEKNLQKIKRAASCSTILKRIPFDDIFGQLIEAVQDA